MDSEIKKNVLHVLDKLTCAINNWNDIENVESGEIRINSSNKTHKIHIGLGLCHNFFEFPFEKMCFETQDLIWDMCVEPYINKFGHKSENGTFDKSCFISG